MGAVEVPDLLLTRCLAAVDELTGDGVPVQRVHRAEVHLTPSSPLQPPLRRVQWRRPQLQIALGDTSSIVGHHLLIRPVHAPVIKVPVQPPDVDHRIVHAAPAQAPRDLRVRGCQQLPLVLRRVQRVGGDVGPVQGHVEEGEVGVEDEAAAIERVLGGSAGLEKEDGVVGLREAGSDDGAGGAAADDNEVELLAGRGGGGGAVGRGMEGGGRGGGEGGRGEDEGGQVEKEDAEEEEQAASSHDRGGMWSVDR